VAAAKASTRLRYSSSVDHGMTFVDEVNLSSFEKHFSRGLAPHTMPDMNTVRCERWYFRKNRKPGKLLDYGFGYGQELVYFADNGYDVYGLDISPSAEHRFEDYVRRHRPDLRGKIKTSILDQLASRLPYEDNWFDFIHSSSVIHYLPSGDAVERLLNEWHRVLKPRGLLMFSTVGPQNSFIDQGVEISENIYEWEDHLLAGSESKKSRSFLMRDEEHIKRLCAMFNVREIGWHTLHYCGVDDFHWQVMAEKPHNVSLASL
jgi:SAM-dependent methyltransferase